MAVRPLMASGQPYRLSLFAAPQRKQACYPEPRSNLFRCQRKRSGYWTKSTRILWPWFYRTMSEILGSVTVINGRNCVAKREHQLQSHDKLRKSCLRFNIAENALVPASVTPENAEVTCMGCGLRTRAWWLRIIGSVVARIRSLIHYLLKLRETRVVTRHWHCW